MNAGRRYRIPSSSALIAFESAARHCNFSRAAEELNTSQSAISRHINQLEKRLGVVLFVRSSSRRRLSLTSAGELFQQAVSASLETLQNATHTLQQESRADSLVIACSHEISHLFLMPRFADLQQAVGSHVQIQVMTYEYRVLESMPAPHLDLILSYEKSGVAPENRQRIFQDAVQPVCSPAFWQAHQPVLTQDIQYWGSIPFLSLNKRNRGWVSWQDWFAVKGVPQTAPRYIDYNNYVYLLDAAVAGQGVALGWRELIERYVEAGMLVPLHTEFVSFHHALYALLTDKGSRRGVARCCLDFFAENALP